MSEDTFKDDIRALKIMHGAMTAGVCLLILVFTFMKNPDGSLWGGKLNSVEYFIIGMASSLVFVLYWVYGQKKMKIRSMPKEEKWSAYRPLQIFSYAILEMSALLCTIMYYLYGNGIMLIFGLVFVSLLAFSRPSAAKYQAEVM